MYYNNESSEGKLKFQVHTKLNRFFFSQDAENESY